MTPIYQITLTQTGAGTDRLFNNVFYYRPADSIGLPGTAAALAASFIEDQFTDENSDPVSILGAINALQSNAITNLSVTSISLFDPLDFASILLSGGGQVNSPVSSYVSAFRYRTTRVRRDIRRGQKRFVGVAEESANNGELPSAGDPGTRYRTLEIILGASLDAAAVGGTIQVIPVVVKRIRFETPTGAVRYRLPATEFELADNYFDATSWETDTTVSTQTSRRNRVTVS